MEELSRIKPTIISKKIWIDPPRDHDNPTLSELAKWVNKARSRIRPWDVDCVEKRFLEHSQASLLNEITAIARNLVGTEPLSYPANLYPIQVLNESERFLWAGINGRDSELATDMLLTHLRFILGTRHDQHFSPLSVPILLSEYQNRMHNVLEGTGRLSRMLAILYWPEEFVVQPEHIDRILHGSTSYQDNYISFTDPSINLINIYEEQFFNALIDSKTNIGYITTVDSFTEGFPEGSYFAKQLDKAITQFRPQRYEAIFSAIESKYHTDIAHALLHGMDPIDSITLDRNEDMQRHMLYSDIYECSIALDWDVASTKIISDSLKLINKIKPETMGQATNIISNCSRRTRIEFLNYVFQSIYMQDITARQLDTQPAIADVLATQYRDGIDWVMQGITPNPSYSPLRIRTYEINKDRIGIEPPIRTIELPPIRKPY